jgi:putative peptide zinc metalloprotease protein
MATTACMMSSQRHLKVRPDLQVEHQVYDGNPYYVVKDPLTLKYFRMKELEYFIFRLFDGTNTIADIQLRISEEFGGLTVSEEHIKEFVQSLHNMNMLDSFGRGAGKVLFKRTGLKRKQLFKQTLKSFFFIKVPLTDPENFFERFYPYLSFIWTKTFLYIWWALLALAVFIIAANGKEFVMQIQGFLSPANFLLFWFAIIIIKTLHELGHGFTCKHYGGEVHELGILFIVFTPWLYCNVSDAWIFKNNRQKFLVSVAGIMAELLVASIATLIWWRTLPGVINSLAYSIIIICSVDNILRNGNPLLRYDGYYSLADYLEIPNLRMRSSTYLLNLFKKHFLQVNITDEEENLTSRRKKTYVIYGVLSFIYRVFIVSVIVGFMASKFFFVGVVLAAFLVFGFFVKPVINSIRFLVQQRAQIRFARLALTLLIIMPVTVSCLVFYKPQLTVATSCAVEGVEQAVVRAGASGYLETTPFHGDSVKKGQIIASLANPELLAQKEKFDLEKRIVEKMREKALGENRIVEYQLLQADLQRYSSEIDELQKKIDKLTIESEIDGVVVTPRVEERLGDFIREGEILFELADYRQVKINIIIPEAEMSKVEVGQEVELKTHSFPAQTFAGRVREIAPAQVASLDNLALSSRFGGVLPTAPDYEKGETPNLPYFQVSMILDNSDGFLRPGMTGVSRILTGEKPLAAILWYKLMRFAKFDFFL